MPTDPSRVKVTGPLVPYVAGFRLLSSKLRATSATRWPTSCACWRTWSRWMGTSGVSLVQLGPGPWDEFIPVRRQAGYTLWLSRKALVPSLNYLEGIGARPVTVEVPVPRPGDAVAGLLQVVPSYRACARARVGSSLAAGGPVFPRHASPSRRPWAI